MTPSAKDIKTAVNQRFIEIVERLMEKYGFSNQTRFGKEIGEASQFFTDIKSGKLYVNTNHVSKLLERFPEIDVSFILTGKKNTQESESKGNYESEESIINSLAKELEEKKQENQYLKKQNDRLLGIIENSQGGDIYKKSFEALIRAIEANGIKIDDLIQVRGPESASL